MRGWRKGVLPTKDLAFSATRPHAGLLLFLTWLLSLGPRSGTPSWPPTHAHSHFYASALITAVPCASPSDPRFPQLCVLSAFLIGTEDIVLAVVVMITVIRNNINDNGLWLLRSRDEAEREEV